MHMIGHDAPGTQLITLPVEVKKRGLDQSRDLSIPQPTLSSDLVELRLNQRLIEFTQFRPNLLQICTTVPRSSLILQKLQAAQQHFPSASKLIQHGLRQCVGEAERDGIDPSLHFPVGKIG